MSDQVHDDEELALLACTKSLLNYEHVSSRLIEDERFQMKLVESYVLPCTSDPRKFTSPYWDNGEKWIAVLYSNPRGFIKLLRLFNDAVIFIELQRVDLDREMVLSVLKEEPQILDVLPQYWGDREACLTAINAVDTTIEKNSRPVNFLTTCEDTEVLDTATRLLPYSIARLSSRFRRDKKELFIRHLEHVDREDFIMWHNAEKDTTTFLTDPQVIAIILDKEFLRNHQWQPECPQFDDYDWIKERITRNPEAWVYASDRLKKDKDLLLFALGNYRYGRQMIQLKFELIPPILQEDPEIHRHLANICELDENLPRRFWTPDLVSSYCDKFPDNVLSFEPDQYELARELVLRDIRYTLKTGQFAEEFIKDPHIAPYLRTHRFEMWMYTQIRHPSYFRDKERGDAMYDFILEPNDQEPNVKYPELTKDVARRIWNQYPNLYGNNGFWKYIYGRDENMVSKRWFDKDFVVQALRTDPNRFWSLPKEFVFDFDIQELSRCRFSSDTCPSLPC